MADTPEALLKVDKLILPGIGAYDHGVEQLADRGLIDALKRRLVEDRVPILGVCLGMQLLGLQSAEGVRQGFGLIDARCERFQPDSAARLRVPRMGWNDLESVRQSPILNGIDASARFYFVHSYHMVCSNPADVLATVNYGIRFTAMIQRGTFTALSSILRRATVLRYVIKKLGLDEAQFEALMKLPRRTFRDYPNNFERIQQLKRSVNFLRARGWYAR